MRELREWISDKMRRRPRRGPNDSESTGKSGQELPANQPAPLRPTYPEAAPARAAEVIGTWKGTMTSNEGGKFPMTMVLNKDGDSLSENFMGRRSTAPKIVIIHARQIIVNERIGVHAFDGAGQRQSGR